VYAEQFDGPLDAASLDFPRIWYLKPEKQNIYYLRTPQRRQQHRPPYLSTVYDMVKFKPKMNLKMAIYLLKIWKFFPFTKNKQNLI
jgi:hypothetical protein